MEKINIAELLKDCPKGMELDCTMFENVTFEGIKQGEYPIIVKIKEPSMLLSLTKTGCWNLYNSAKCVIFPKDKTTWEGFVPPCKFEDGDVVVADNDEEFQLFLLKHLTHSEDDNSYNGYCYFGWDFQCNELFEKGNWGFNRHATEEEKAKLFQAIKDNGYKWNPETKTLEKLVKPRFKVGDIIQDIDTYKVKITEVNIYDECYSYESMIAKEIGSIAFNEQDDWELVPNKFDITTLKPFDKVLVRLCDADKWDGDFYMWYNNTQKEFPYYCVNSVWSHCIPYEGNENLIGKTDDCDEYFKNWK